MAAFEHLQASAARTRVFDSLVESLGTFVNSRGVFGSKVGGKQLDIKTSEKSKALAEKEGREYLVSIVTLIRFIVEIPSEFEFRMHIRNELLNSGLAQHFVV